MTRLSLATKWALLVTLPFCAAGFMAVEWAMAVHT